MRELKKDELMKVSGGRLMFPFPPPNDIPEKGLYLIMENPSKKIDI